MAASEAQICNLALLRIGQTRTIDALTDDTEEARACAMIYPHARDALLEAFPWPFAMRRATLARLVGVERDGWNGAYSLPADCLVPREVWSGQRIPPVASAVPYAIEDDAGQGRILLCDEDNVTLIYTARLEAPGLFPPLVTDALVWSVASELAMALPVKDAVQVRAKQGYELALGRAKAAVLNQQRDRLPTTPTIAARAY